MGNPIIFKALPETFPEHDEYKKTSLISALLGHVFLVCALLAIPFFVIEEIPQLDLLTELVAPPPPPPAAPLAPAVAVGVVQPAKPALVRVERPASDALIMPTIVPKEIARIIDEPISEGGVAGGVIGGVPGGAVGGVIGGVLARNALASTPLEAPLPPPPPPVVTKSMDTPREPVRVGGEVREPRLVKLVPPKYPKLASRARVHGTVVLEAIVTEIGTVDEIRVISGHPLLVEAAIDCVKQWRYEPTLLNGTPVAVVLTAQVTFQQAPMSD